LNCYKIVLIPNGVDLEQFNPTAESSAYLRQIYNLPSDFLVIGTVAAFKPQKGLQYLIAAAAQVASQHPRGRFLLIGSGPQEAMIRTWIHEAGLDQVFILAAQRYDIPQLLAAMDLFVLPSLWEGMPRALLEAMAMGRPCIATDWWFKRTHPT
jgi:glycosyltransferase involved in cell wall biosynthesis